MLLFETFDPQLQALEDVTNVVITILLNEASNFSGVSNFTEFWW